MLAFLIAFSCVLTACTPRRGTASSDSSSNPLKGADASGDTRLNVVTTLFPYYDFLRQIAGDSIRLTMVVPAGMDSHSFEPTPADMITIQNADLLVCNGGTMEQWLSQVLDSFGEGTGPKRVVTMMDCVDVVQEEIVEGMEDGEAHDHGHTHVHADGTVHAGDHDHESEDHAHSEEEHEPEDHVYSEEEHEPEDYVYSEEEHDTEEHIHSEDEHDREDVAVHDEDHAQEYLDEDDGHGVEIEYDEHIWTSPVNAKKLAGVLAEVELFNEGKPVDLVTLQNRLREKDVPPEVSSLDFVRDIMTSVPTSVNVKSYANIVREKAVLRRLIKVNEEIENLCYGGRDKLEDILAHTEKSVFDLLQSRGDGIRRLVQDRRQVLLLRR